MIYGSTDEYTADDGWTVVSVKEYGKSNYILSTRNASALPLTSFIMGYSYPCMDPDQVPQPKNINFYPT